MGYIYVPWLLPTHISTYPFSRLLQLCLFSRESRFIKKLSDSTGPNNSQAITGNKRFNFGIHSLHHTFKWYTVKKKHTQKRWTRQLFLVQWTNTKRNDTEKQFQFFWLLYLDAGPLFFNIAKIRFDKYLPG